MSKIFRGNFNFLLIILILLILIKPGVWIQSYVGIWDLVFLGALVTAIFNCDHPKSIKIIAICLAIPAFFFNIFSLFHPSKAFILTAQIISICFLLVATLSIMYRVVFRIHVTGETLKAAICAYLMIGFIFSICFFLMETITPGSFKIPSEIDFTSHHFLASELVYFSFNVLTTLGMGDISPLKPIGQSFVAIEAIIGQFYIAIPVAKLVTIYTREHKKGL